MLLAVRNHLREAGVATRDEIAARFDLEPATVEGLLDLLVRRGDAAREAAGGSCSGCSGCSGACGTGQPPLYRVVPRHQSGNRSKGRMS